MSEMPDLPSFYDWGAGKLMPIDPPPPGCDDPLRFALDDYARRVMQEAADHIARLVRPNSILMLPGAESPADGICDVVTTLVRCTSPAAWHIWLGCTQEHLVEGWVCTGHLELLEAGCHQHWCASCREYNLAQQELPEAGRKPQVDEIWQILRKEAA